MTFILRCLLSSRASHNGRVARDGGISGFVGPCRAICRQNKYSSRLFILTVRRKRVHRTYMGINVLLASRAVQDVGEGQW